MNDKFNDLWTARSYTEEMNAKREAAEKWCDLMNKLTMEKDAEVAALRARVKELEDRWQRAVEESTRQVQAAETALALARTILNDMPLFVGHIQAADTLSKLRALLTIPITGRVPVRPKG